MNIKDFLIDNYIWILVVILLLIVTVIGFLADKKKNSKQNNNGDVPTPNPGNQIGSVGANEQINYNANVATMPNQIQTPGMPANLGQPLNTTVTPNNQVATFSMESPAVNSMPIQENQNLNSGMVNNMNGMNVIPTEVPNMMVNNVVPEPMNQSILTQPSQTIQNGNVGVVQQVGNLTMPEQQPVLQNLTPEQNAYQQTSVGMNQPISNMTQPVGVTPVQNVSPIPSPVTPNVNPAPIPNPVMQQPVNPLPVQGNVPENSQVVQPQVGQPSAAPEPQAINSQPISFVFGPQNNSNQNM